VIVDKSVFFGYFNSQTAPSFFDNRLQTLLFFVLKKKQERKTNMNSEKHKNHG